MKTQKRLHWKPKRTATLSHSSNTDTVTHSNHNCESADSQTSKHLCQQAHATPGPRTTGEVSVHLGHFPVVLPSVSLFVCHLCRTSILGLCRHRNYACYDDRDLMTNALFVVQQHWIDFADGCDVFILSHRLFFFFLNNTTLHNMLLFPTVLSNKARYKTIYHRITLWCVLTYVEYFARCKYLV